MDHKQIWVGIPPPKKKCPFRLGIWDRPNTWFPGPTRVRIQNDTSIGSSVSAGIAVVINRQTTHTQLPIRRIAMRPNNNKIVRSNLGTGRIAGEDFFAGRNERNALHRTLGIIAEIISLRRTINSTENPHGFQWSGRPPPKKTLSFEGIWTSI